MFRLTSRATAFVVALACLAWPLASVQAATCPARAQVSCSHCPKSSKRVQARAIAASVPRCCLVKSSAQPPAPLPSARVQQHERVDAAAPPPAPAFVAAPLELDVHPPVALALPPRVIQRTHPLLR